MKKQHITPGLDVLPQDNRDFVFGSIFGQKEKPDFPESLFVNVPLKIKDQGKTDFCTAFAVTSVSEDQEGTELNAHYTMAKTKSISGKPIDSWGENLRDACKSVVKYGSLEQEIYPFYNKDQEKDRAFLVDSKNWSEDLDMFAFDFRKNSFFRVDTGHYDIFDNIRFALLKNREYMRSVATGAEWYDSWTKSEKGIISDKKPTGKVGGHAFKVFGFTKIEDTEYLVAQLSNGDDIGDAGVFYFPRAIVNKYFTFGAFMFHDMPKDEAEHYSDAGIHITDSKLVRILKSIKSIFKNIL